MATEQAMNAVPKTLQAGPYTYAVEFDGVAAYEDDFWGQAGYRTRKIKLNPMQPDTQTPQTMMHEALHVLGEAFEIDGWKKHVYDENEKCVDKIDLMATALLTFIRQNKDAVKWMQGDAT